VGDASLDAVARVLGTSRRSLQRDLATDGASFKGITDLVRRHLACDLLEQQRRSVGEIAFSLGFSEASAFHRAFRRWTGTTPQEYRRRFRQRL